MAWVNDYVDQWCAFPAGAHDDMVDSSTQALRYMLHMSGEGALPRQSEQEELPMLADDILADSATLYDPYGLDGMY
jgi:hypothetical protein